MPFVIHDGDASNFLQYPEDSWVKVVVSLVGIRLLAALVCTKLALLLKHISRHRLTFLICKFVMFGSLVKLGQWMTCM